MRVDKKRLMILGASILQLPAIQKAKEMGLTVIAVDIEEQAIGFKEADICLPISTIDTEKVLEAAKKYEIDGIMTLASDMPMRVIAKVSKEMDLVGINEATALKTTNKIIMRQALLKNKVPIPYFYKASNESEFLEAVEYIKHKECRCIVKAADNSGSRGVDLLRDFKKATLKKAYKYCKQYSRSGDVIVEEYMEGPEVSVETLSIDGECRVIQITDKLTTGAPYFVEIGHSQPSELDIKIKKKIEAVAILANKAVGITNGPSHTEIIVTKEGPKVVELGARLGGDNITTHLVPLSTGIDMVECCIQIALGERPNYEAKLEKASAIRYIKSNEGIINSIFGVNNARKMEGIQQVSIVHDVGYQMKSIKSSADRLGFVIAQGDTIKDAINFCENALKIIKVGIEDS